MDYQDGDKLRMHLVNRSKRGNGRDFAAKAAILAKY
jgi:hypothetical protein